MFIDGLTLEGSCDRVNWCVYVRWTRGEVVAEEKEDPAVEKESSSRRRSRRDREQDLAKKMTTTEVLSDRFESRGELKAVDTEYVSSIIFSNILLYNSA